MGDLGVDGWPILPEARLRFWCGSEQRSEGKEESLNVVEVWTRSAVTDLGMVCGQGGAERCGALIFPARLSTLWAKSSRRYFLYPYRRVSSCRAIRHDIDFEPTGTLYFISRVVSRRVISVEQKNAGDLHVGFL